MTKGKLEDRVLNPEIWDFLGDMSVRHQAFCFGISQERMDWVVDYVGQISLEDLPRGILDTFHIGVIKNAAYGYFVTLWYAYLEKIDSQAADLINKRKALASYMATYEEGLTVLVDHLGTDAFHQCINKISDDLLSFVEERGIFVGLVHEALSLQVLWALMEYEADISGVSQSPSTSSLDDVREIFLNSAEWLKKGWLEATIQVGGALGESKARLDEQLSLQQIEKNLGFFEVFKIKEFSLFSSNNLGVIDNSLLTQNVTLASVRSPEIEMNGQGEGEYCFDKDSIPRVSIYLTKTAPYSGNPMVLAFEQARQVAEQIDSKVAIAHLILSAFAQEQDWKRVFRIDHRTLADLMWKDATRSTKSYIKQVNQTMSLLCRMQLRIQDHNFEWRGMIWEISTFANREGAFFEISPGKWVKHLKQSGRHFTTNDVFYLRKDSPALKIGLTILSNSKKTWTVEELIYQSMGSTCLRKSRFLESIETLRHVLNWKINLTQKNNWHESIVSIRPRLLQPTTTVKPHQNNISPDFLPLSTQVQEYCHRNNIPASELAALIDVSESTLSRLKNGQRISARKQNQITSFLKRAS